MSVKQLVTQMSCGCQVLYKTETRAVVRAARVSRRVVLEDKQFYQASVCTKYIACASAFSRQDLYIAEQLPDTCCLMLSHAQVETIYRDHKHSLLRYIQHTISRMPNLKCDAEDLFQDLMVRCLTFDGEFREECSLHTFMHTAARNLILQRNRAQRNLYSKNPSLEGMELAERRESVEDRVCREQEIDRVIAITAHASHKNLAQVETLRLRLDGYSCDEVARLQQIPEGTVRIRMKRIRDRARRNINTFMRPSAETLLESAKRTGAATARHHAS